MKEKWGNNYKTDKERGILIFNFFLVNDFAVTKQEEQVGDGGNNVFSRINIEWSGARKTSMTTCISEMTFDRKKLLTRTKGFCLLISAQAVQLK